MSERITEEQKEVAVSVYRLTGLITEAAKTAGVSRVTLWKEQKRSITFKKAMEDAREEYADQLEKEGDTLTRDRHDMPSVTWRIFRLKALRPDMYRERVDHKVDTDIRIITATPRPGDNPQLTKGKGEK